MIYLARSAAGDSVLFISPAGSYRLSAFTRAAQQLGFKPVIASTGSDAIITSTVAGVRVNLDNMEQAVDEVLRALFDTSIQAVIATDDATTEIVSVVANRMGLPHNPITASQRTRHKDLGRACLANNGLLVPAFQTIRLNETLSTQLKEVNFPCVVKPLALSASRGVIRANNQNELLAACRRIKQLLEKEGIVPAVGLIEDFIPGVEVAVEGLLHDGTLSVLAIFDKPDALDGPYFEETYYITPSRHTSEIQQSIIDTIQQACAAYALREGPVHAECRINEQGVWVLELAARTIGGECSRIFEYTLGCPLEKLVIKNAVGNIDPATGMNRAAGVLMLPVERGGVLRRVEGLLAAGKIEFIEQIIIDARTGQELIPWPEGCAYPGFIFARAPAPELVEKALRQAHKQLNFVVAPNLPVSIAA